MPITKSAKKALRQSTKRRARNVSQKKTLKQAVKAFHKNPSNESLGAAYKKLDKAAKVNLIKKNKASRMKSRLAKRLTKTG